MLKQAIFIAFVVIAMTGSIAISAVPLLQQALAFTNDGEEINAHPSLIKRDGNSGENGKNSGNSANQGIGQSQRR